MVFLKNFARDFYHVVQNQRILILVSRSVDSLCCCKILQYLFQCDHVQYTIVDVNTNTELENAYLEHSEGVKYVLLINCGGTVDLVSKLDPSPGVVFYICDSHRPLDVHNIYNMEQTKLLVDEDELKGDIPAFAEVFRESDTDEDSENDSDSSEPRRQYSEARLQKRAERRAWEERRTRRLREYTQLNSVGGSAACQMLDMAWKMSRDTNDLVWLGAVGLMSQYLNSHINRDRYIDQAFILNGHVSRHNHRPHEDGHGPSVSALKLEFGEHLQLALYKHWSLYESLNHTRYTANCFKIWTLKGRKKLHEYLADMGLPLVQCRQKFMSMDVSFKDGIDDMIRNSVEKYRLSNDDLFLPSFSAQYGYNSKYFAADVVYACQALLEAQPEDEDKTSFHVALDAFNRSRVDLMVRGLELARAQAQAVARQVQSFLDISLIANASPFVYVFVQEGSPDAQHFTGAVCLERLARFALEAYVSTQPARNQKKARNLPLVLGGPPQEDSYLVVGVPPLSDTSCTSFFAQAFDLAAKHVHARIMNEYFTPHVINLKLEDKSKFIDALIHILAN